MANRLLNLAVALDQFLFCVLTLGNSFPDETASAAAYRLEKLGRWQGRFFRPFIDFLFLPFERDHCRKAYDSEVRRMQLPNVYRGF